MYLEDSACIGITLRRVLHSRDVLSRVNRTSDTFNNSRDPWGDESGFKYKYVAA